MKEPLNFRLYLETGFTMLRLQETIDGMQSLLTSEPVPVIRERRERRILDNLRNYGGGSD